MDRLSGAAAASSVFLVSKTTSLLCPACFPLSSAATARLAYEECSSEAGAGVDLSALCLACIRTTFGALLCHETAAEHRKRKEPPTLLLRPIPDGRAWAAASPGHSRIRGGQSPAQNWGCDQEAGALRRRTRYRPAGRGSGAGSGRAGVSLDPAASGRIRPPVRIRPSWPLASNTFRAR